MRYDGMVVPAIRASTFCGETSKAPFCLAAHCLVGWQLIRFSHPHWRLLFVLRQRLLPLHGRRSRQGRGGKHGQSHWVSVRASAVETQTSVGAATMPEGMNVEIAHKLTESEASRKKSRREEMIEIAEALVLGLVAVATAWSGYQSALWDGRQAILYGTSGRLRVEAGVAATEGGQQRLLDVVTFNTWMQAKEAKDEKLAAIYVRRFSPEYRIAFDAWLKTEPFTNADAPSGPTRVPSYRNALLEESGQLNKNADAAFLEGTAAGETAEKYVRGTVLLATVLFLIALAQRFKVRARPRGDARRGRRADGVCAYRGGNVPPALECEKQIQTKRPCGCTRAQSVLA